MRWTKLTIVIVMLLAAACSGHDSTESSGDGGTAGSATTTTEGGGGTEPGLFGDMDEPVCGPGDASGSTDQGVTDDTIKVGTLSDAGNTIIPGLLQELFDASEAFVAWCNDAGGINGRQIELVKRDTRMIENQQRITEACAEDFMLVGGGTALDANIVDLRVNCGLPQIPAFLNTPEARDAPLQVKSLGNFSDYVDVTIYRLARDQLGEDVNKYGMLSVGTTGSGPDPVIVKITDAVGSLGYDVVYSDVYPPPPATVDNWGPYLKTAQDDGVEIFEFYNAGEGTLPVMTTMQEVGFLPTAMLGNPGQYSSALIEGNDALADIPTWVETYQYPFEMADQNPPTQQFLDLMDAQFPGWSDNPKALAVQSWSSWLLFAQAAKACGSDLTRDCVMEQAAAAGVWDAGGIAAPYTVTDANVPAGPRCAAILRATPDGFEYDEEWTQPNDGIFNCDEKNTVKVEG